MERLDQTYIIDIVRRMRGGSANAFAEIYAAFCETHYSYLTFILGSESGAKKQLANVYERMIKSMASLHNDALFVPWSLRLILRYCAEEEIFDVNRQADTPIGPCSISRLMALPLTESQMAIMRYAQKLNLKTIADLMNTDKRTVKLCLKEAIRHLHKGGGHDEEPLKAVETIEGSTFSIIKPDEEFSVQLLEQVYEECDMKPNTVPLEALSAYAIYRKERFSLQRAILIAAMVIFLFLPVCFLRPVYEVTFASEGERGLPEYIVSVKSLLPTGKVTARLNTHDVPVYEASAREYTIEPIRNGTLTIYVELINQQNSRTECNVTEVDAQSPQLVGSSTADGQVHLYIEDSGIGVDYREIYAVATDGGIYYPLSVDEETGKIVFAYPRENWDVYIPDYIGNTLHLEFAIE